MSDDRYLTFALGKGRLAKKTLQLFEQIGITCEEMKDPDSLDFSWQRDLMCLHTWSMALPISVW